MSTFEIGSDHPFPFPKMKGFLSVAKTEETVKQLQDNAVWNLSEKLDGCNVCVSTQGWFASRNKIVADCLDANLPESKLNLAKLKNVPLVYKQALRMKQVLTKFFQHIAFEVMIYGELVLPGTSTTSFDVYNYSGRNIFPGQIYAFALGLVLPENTPIPFFFRHGFYEKGIQNYYIVPMNSYLAEMFRSLDICHIPPVASNRLAELLLNKQHNDILLNRKKEGFVLTGNNGQGYIKWKYNRADVKPELAEVADNLIQSQLPGSNNESAASRIKMVFEFGQHFVNKSEEVDHIAFFNDYMLQNKDRWDSIFSEAAGYGYFYLTAAMYNLEAEVLRELVSSIKINHKKQLDPKIIQVFELIISSLVEEWCVYYIKQTRDQIPDDECKCNL